MSAQTHAYSFLQPSSQPGDLGMLGNYRILGELGKGGMGYVFRAEDTVLERAVALKVMNKKIASTPNSRDRFLQEARAMAAVHHDNVVVIFEVGTNEGTPFMAMEMLRGETLEAVNSRSEARDYEAIIRCASQITKGLAAAHAKGIVHRDIKPANIWIEEGSQRIKILDFGLALAQSPLDEFAGVGSVCGTPGYLTPEQARSDPLDDRSDLYSLGVVLYEMCTGRLPIQRPAIAEQLVALLSHAPKPLREINPDIPQPLADLIHRLLAKEPVDRPASASTLEKQLKQVAIECDAKSETTLSLNKLQESLKEVVSKQAVVEEPAEVIDEMPALPSFDPLTTPAAVTATTNAPGSTPAPAVKRIGTPAKPNAKPTPQPASAPVSPVVWLAAGVGITLGVVGLAVWMILPPKQESFVIRVPESSGDPTQATSPQPAAPLSDPPENKEQPTNPSDIEPQAKRQPVGQKNRPEQKEVPLDRNDPKEASGSKPNKNTTTKKDEVSPPSMDTPQPDRSPSDSFPVGRPDATVAMKVANENPTKTPDGSMAEPMSGLEGSNSFESRDSASATKPADDSVELSTVSISTADGRGADSTVRRSSGKLALGLKSNLAVQKNQNEDLQHVYLRFDLESLPTDRNEIRDAAVRLQLIATARDEALTLRLYGTDAPAAEKWTEDGPLSITWNRSFSMTDLADLPKLAEFTGVPVDGNTVIFRDDQIANFVRESKGRSVTFVVAGGKESSLAVLFISREKDAEKAPELMVRIPKL